MNLASAELVKREVRGQIVQFSAFLAISSNTAMCQFVVVSFSQVGNAFHLNGVKMFIKILQTLRWWLYLK